MYKYEDFRANTLTEQGQRILIKTRDAVMEKFKYAPEAYFRLDDLTPLVSGVCGNWDQAAYIDRLLEIGDLRELKTSDGIRLFTKRK